MGNQSKSSNNALCSSDLSRIGVGSAVSEVPDRKELTFTQEDYGNLCENEYYRFIPNSDVIGGAVVFYNGKKVVAHQYEMPKVEGAPTWKPLKDITPINRFGRQVYQAQTLDGNTVYATRSYTFTDEHNKKYTFLPFAPPPKGKNEPFWGSTKLVPITKKPVNSDKYYIGGRELKVDPESVVERSAVTRRNPDQNTVMGYSAKEAYEFYYEQMADKLTPEMREIFERAIEADLRNPFQSNYRPEWLHAEGYSLTPSWIDPQRPDNLGSGPKWANTMMMVLERVAKWYALHCPNSYVTIKPTFEMLFDTELIKTLDFEVRVGFKDHFLRFMQHLEPLQQKYPVFPVASDIAQLTGVSQAILTNKQPTVVSVISQGRSADKWNASFNKSQAAYPTRLTRDSDDSQAEESLTAANDEDMEESASDVTHMAKSKEKGRQKDIPDAQMNSTNAKSSQLGLFANTQHRYPLRTTPSRQHAMS
ncbi:hypothetical protein [Legionella sp. W05-934-2]|jgi:large subunit ribosomal protein L28|uniref:hypothetical protein n=1 Tax=Legionella sp. W05-934-2 TaxID=1198649 RepID=UPI0034636F5F